jgi:hypothetical protein
MGVTCREPADFRDKEGGAGVFQLGRLLREVEGRGEICGHVFRAVIVDERLRESARSQLGQQTGVLGAGATYRQIRVSTHTIYSGNNEDAE